MITVAPISPHAGRHKSSQFRQRANGARLPELRNALFRPTGQSTTFRTLLLGLIPLAWTSLSPAQVAAQNHVEQPLEIDAADLLIDPGFEMAVSNFDQWIFGGQYADQGRKKVESVLTLKIDSIDRACGLSESQTAKLHLAGQGDIKRFYDDVEAARVKFMKVRRNRNAINNIFQEIQPLQARVNAGLFGQSSFFQKVLNRTLDDEQSAKFEESERLRWKFRHDAGLSLVIAMMERTVPLRSGQRERFIAVLKEETKSVKVTGQYGYYGVQERAFRYYLALYQMAQVPEEKLQPIFDDAQWKVIQNFQAQGLAMEQWLKQQKVLP